MANLYGMTTRTPKRRRRRRRAVIPVLLEVNHDLVTSLSGVLLRRGSRAPRGVREGRRSDGHAQRALTRPRGRGPYGLWGIFESLRLGRRQRS